MYQALYRKYRPQTFDEVVGQRSVTETLKSQLRTGRLSHAYLFTGTRGTGKTSCAKILAKAVNCLDLHDGNPCNCCEACRSIDSGSCTDVLEIDAASNNGVDQVRALRDEAVFTPAQVRKRVYIIDEVHMLSIAAFNALLKIIEEPPEHLLFILATTELHKVPATILSRCQRFSFRRLNAEDIASRLNFAAYQENIQIEPEAVNVLARIADGALRDGMSLLDQCASSSSGNLTVQTVYQVLGLAGDRKTAQMMGYISQHNASAALSAFSELYAEGKDIAAMADELTQLARDLLLLKTAGAAAQSMLSGICTQEEIKPLQNISAGELMHITRTLQETASTFSRSSNRKLDMELCIMNLCTDSLHLDADSLNARLSRLEDQIKNGAVVSIREAETKKPEKSDIPEETVNMPESKESQQKAASSTDAPLGFWADFTARIKPELPVRARGFFVNGGPVSGELNGDLLILNAESSFVKGIISDESILSIIRNNAGAMLGRNIGVKVALRGTNTQDDSAFSELIAFGKAHTDIFDIKE